jgi:hypothetical protein
MDNLLPDRDAGFRWRNCTVNVRKAAERYGSVEVQNDSAENVHLALAELDTRLFAEGFGPELIANLSEDQLRGWMHWILRAWAVNITEYLPEPYNPRVAGELRDISGTWAKYRQEANERQRTTVERNKPRLERAWAALRELKISSVLVEFSGVGDSGEIDSIEPSFDEQSTIVPDEHLLANMMATYRSKEVLMPNEAAPVRLEDLIEELSNDLLGRAETPDWFNNDGGYGTLEWRVNPDGSNVLNVTVHQRVTEYDTTVLIYNGLGEMTATDYQGRSN